jgi:hypothetical protein
MLRRTDEVLAGESTLSVSSHACFSVVMRRRAASSSQTALRIKASRLEAVSGDRHAHE